MARPSKLTPETQAAIVKALRIGATYDVAAQAAGVAYDTLREWIKKGEAGQSKYRQFSEALRAAEAECRLNYTAVIAKAANDGDWRAALEYLKRRDRTNWGDQVAVTGADGGPLLIGFSEDVGKL